jgi:hypothetical protein
MQISVCGSAGSGRRILDRIGAMHFAETDEFEPAAHEEAARIADPRRMTRSQLRRLGMPRLVYLRCGTVDGQTAFAVHAADGTAMAVVEDLEVAMELASECNMIFVSVH